MKTNWGLFSPAAFFKKKDFIDSGRRFCHFHAKFCAVMTSVRHPASVSAFGMTERCVSSVLGLFQPTRLTNSDSNVLKCARLSLIRPLCCYSIQ